jgi:hypothetical protein
MKKRVISQVAPGSQAKTLAVFEMVGDELRSKYTDASFMEHVRGVGIMVAGRELHPEDGRAFFDGLDEGFANSSRVTVVADRTP